MGLYELTIDPNLVEEAEEITSVDALAKREFPTLVVNWESKIFGQAWSSTIVLDYVLALPPLEPSVTFIPVRVGAFVGGAPTKYFYFGTEMSNTVPRLAPEMENLVTPQAQFQEFLIDERTSPIPYLKLIQATPRIYGNGAQDYYAPPIKVERYDGTVSPEHLADLFPEQVANLPTIAGSVLTDPLLGFWEGQRYAGIRSIAIVRQGKVVGLHRKQGRPDKEVAPPVVVRRDPKKDIRGDWVAIDVGARSITVACRHERGQAELFRLGTQEPVKRPADYENPAEVSFISLRNTLRSWRERVIQPHTSFDDVRVGFGVADLEGARGASPKSFQRATSTITELPLVREWTDEGRTYKLRGYKDAETAEALKKPAPPIIDEDGIGAHDPFDPVELYGYQIGLHVNQRMRGLTTKYLVSMPTGWSPERRKSVLVAIRRGIFRSLPAGMLEYHELDKLIVADAGPSAICFVANAHRAFSALPKDGSITFGVFEAGASETGVVFGILREPSNEEKKEGFSLIIEHLDTQSIPWFGAERLLHRLAYRVYADHVSDMIALGVQFEKPPEEPVIPGAEPLLGSSPEARANTHLLKEAMRPLFEGDPTYRLPTAIKLGGSSGLTDVRVSLNRVALRQLVDAWFTAAVQEFSHHVQAALTRLARGSDPYEGLRVFLGGRVTMHPGLQDILTKSLPSNVRIHKFREPDRTNLSAATVKTATVLGALSLRLDKIGVTRRAEKRDAFRYRVGRARHGQLSDVLEPSVEYDAWREMGPCSKPQVDLLFMRADYDGEVAADDPRIMRVECDLGPDSVGRRVFLRAVGTHRIEVAAATPGEDPGPEDPRVAVELQTGMAFPV
ncbi:MAG: hypothetical protein HOV80_01735 [Polyangiaceae bacterium]|nr:hypothetical protein [Polyangiaceae bacterium]